MDICEICLILNYLGQGAWLLNNQNGKLITTDMISGLDPSNVTVEKFPLIVSLIPNVKLKRIE
ncbi:MAG: hypothetical protein WKF89_13600 [Chitinophagaceae bacterium]